MTRKLQQRKNFKKMKKIIDFEQNLRKQNVQINIFIQTMNTFGYHCTIG